MAKTHSTERKERGTSLTIMKFGESTVFAFTSKKKKESNITVDTLMHQQRKTLRIKINGFSSKNNSHLPDHTQRYRIPKPILMAVRSHLAAQPRSFFLHNHSLQVLICSRCKQNSWKDSAAIFKGFFLYKTRLRCKLVQCWAVKCQMHSRWGRPCWSETEEWCSSAAN